MAGEIVRPNVILPGGQEMTMAAYMAAQAPAPEQRGALGEIATGVKKGAMVDLPNMAGQALKAFGAKGTGQSLVDAAQARAQQEDYTLHPEQHNAVTNALAEGGAMAPAVVGLGAVNMVPVVGQVAAAAGGAALFGGSTYQDVYERAKAAGQTDADAHTAGLKAGAIMGVGGAVLQGVAGRAIGGAVAGRAAATGFEAPAAQAAKGLTMPALKAAAVTTGEMTGVNAAQTAGVRAVEQGVGIDPNGQSPLDAAVASIPASLGLSAALGPFAAFRARAQQAKLNTSLDRINDLTASADARTQAISDIAPMVAAAPPRGADPTAWSRTVNDWRLAAMEAANNGSQIDLSPTFSSEWAGKQLAIQKHTATVTGTDQPLQAALPAPTPMLALPAPKVEPLGPLPRGAEMAAPAPDTVIPMGRSRTLEESIGEGLAAKFPAKPEKPFSLDIPVRQEDVARELDNLGAPERNKQAAAKAAAKEKAEAAKQAEDAALMQRIADRQAKMAPEPTQAPAGDPALRLNLPPEEGVAKVMAGITAQERAQQAKLEASDTEALHGKVKEALVAAGLKPAEPKSFAAFSKEFRKTAFEPTQDQIKQAYAEHQREVMRKNADALEAHDAKAAEPPVDTTPAAPEPKTAEQVARERAATPVANNQLGSKLTHELGRQQAEREKQAQLDQIAQAADHQRQLERDAQAQPGDGRGYNAQHLGTLFDEHTQGNDLGLKGQARGKAKMALDEAAKKPLMADQIKALEASRDAIKGASATKDALDSFINHLKSEHGLPTENASEVRQGPESKPAAGEAGRAHAVGDEGSRPAGKGEPVRESPSGKDGGSKAEPVREKVAEPKAPAKEATREELAAANTPERRRADLLESLSVKGKTRVEELDNRIKGVVEDLGRMAKDPHVEQKFVDEAHEHMSELLALKADAAKLDKAAAKAKPKAEPKPEAKAPEAPVAPKPKFVEPKAEDGEHPAVARAQETRDTLDATVVDFKERLKAGEKLTDAERQRMEEATTLRQRINEVVKALEEAGNAPDDKANAHRRSAQDVREQHLDALLEYARETEKPWTETRHFFEGDPSARSNRVMMALVRNTNVHDMLGDLATMSKSPWVRMVAKRLQAMGLNATLHYGPDIPGANPRALGVTSHRRDGATTVHIRVGGESEHVVLHEIIHVATAKMIALARNIGTPKNQREAQLKQAYTRLEAIRKELLAKFPEKEAPTGEPLPIYATSKDHYGLASADEFIAELNTSRKFQDILRAEGTGPKSIWQRVLQVVDGLLGTKLAGHENFLEEALALQSAYFREQNAPLRAGEVGTVQTQTPSFKAWFGGSKVVNDKGEPQVVYHGTSKSFDEFQMGDTTSPTYTHGFYFSDKPGYASVYAGSGEGAKVMPVYLSLKNPLVIDREPIGQWKGAIARLLGMGKQVDLINKMLSDKTSSAFLTPETVAALKAAGFDGIMNHGRSEFIAFDGNQIKSAIGNSGAFDPHSTMIHEYAAAVDGTASKVFSKIDSVLPTAKLDTAKGKAFQAVAYLSSVKHLVDMAGRVQAFKGGFAERVANFKALNEKTQQVHAHVGKEPGEFAMGLERRLAKLKPAERAATEGEMGAIGKLASAYNVDPGKNFADNLKANKNLKPADKAIIDELHNRFTSFSKASPEFARDIKRGEQIGRKSFVNQMAGLARNILHVSSGNMKEREQRVQSAQDALTKALADGKGVDKATREHEEAKQALAHAKENADALTKHDLGLDVMDGKLAEAGIARLAAMQAEAKTPEARAALDRLRAQYHDDAGFEMSRRVEDLFSAAGKLAADNPLRMALKSIDKGYHSQIDNPYLHLGRQGDHFVRVEDVKGLTAQAKAKLDEVFAKHGLVAADLGRTQDHSFSKFDSIEQAAAFARDIKTALGRTDTPAYGKLSENHTLDNRAGVSDAMRQLSDGLHKTFGDVEGLSESQRQQIKDSFTQQLMGLLPETSAAKATMPRKGTPGYAAEYVRSFARRANDLARGTASGYTVRDFTKTFREMREDSEALSKSNPEAQVKAQTIADELGKRHSDAMRRDDGAGSVVNAINGFGFSYYLGASPAFVIRNAMQIWHLGLPELGGKFGYVKSAKALGSASSDAYKILQATIKQGFASGGLRKVLDEGVKLDGLGLSADTQKFVQQMFDSGVIQSGQTNQINQLMGPTGNHTLKDAVRVAGIFADYSEKFNRLAMGIAAFKLSGGNAQYAMGKVEGTMINYEAHNTARALGSHGAAGALTPLMSQFAKYNFGVLEMIHNLAHDALGQQHDGTAKGIKAAKDAQKEAIKTMAGLAATTTALAGVMGLPFVSAFAGLYNMLMDDKDHPQDVRIQIQAYLAKVFGKGVGEMISHGAPRGAGVDMSTIGLQDILPGSGILADRSLMKDKLANNSQEMMGPAINGGMNIAAGLAKMSDGYYMKGLEQLLPTALKNLAKASSTAQHGFTDSKGNPIPAKAGPMDPVIQALGLRPAAKAVSDEQNQAFYADNTLLSHRRGVISDHLYKAYQSRDADEIKEWEAKRAAFNGKNPTEPIRKIDIFRSQAKGMAGAASTGTGIKMTPKQGASRGAEYAIGNVGN